MDYEEMIRGIKEGTICIQCDTPIETGTVLEFLQDEAGISLYPHPYVIAIAGDPRSYANAGFEEEGYWKFTTVAKNTFDDTMSLYLSPFDGTEYISYAEFSRIICDRSDAPFEPASDEDLSSLLSI